MDCQPLSYYLSGILNGDRRILSQSITLIESSLPDHRLLAERIVDELLPHTGKAIRLGITGMPGAGKSTLIENLGLMLVEKGLKVAVLAVDPSSRRSGGSILADKTRMPRLSRHKDAFIRPSPSGGVLGGVSLTTYESMLVCEAARYDVVIVETIGVGQNETAVASMVDFFLVMMIAGAGDSLQGIKRGILELAHLVAVNKADGDNVAAAEKARSEFENALHVMQPVEKGWQARVVTCSALTLAGLEEIWAIVQEHRAHMEKTGALHRHRAEQAVEWMWALIDKGLRERFRDHTEVKGQIPQTTALVREGLLSAPAAARELLLLFNK